MQVKKAEQNNSKSTPVRRNVHSRTCYHRSFIQIYSPTRYNVNIWLRKNQYHQPLALNEYDKPIDVVGVQHSKFLNENLKAATFDYSRNTPEGLHAY